MRHFKRTWLIQRRTFVDDKFVETENLGECDGSFMSAQKLFRTLTGLEPKTEYCMISSVMLEIGGNGIKDSKLFLDAYVRAGRIAYERNFIKVPFEDGSGYYAYGIKSSLKRLTNSED